MQGPHPDAVQAVYDDRFEAVGATRLRLRARARLLLGRLSAAAGDLRAAVDHLAAPAPATGALGINRRRTRPTPDVALIQALELAATQVDEGDGAAALATLPPVEPF